MRIFSYIGMVALAILLAGTSAVHVSQINGAGPVKVLRNVDFDMGVAQGHFGDMYWVSKFGHNPVVDTGTVPEDLWHGGGLYTGFPITGTAETLTITSASAADSLAGAGCQTFTLTGLDGNYDRISETVDLNGIIGVATTQTFWRMNRAWCATAGSTATNDADITVKHTTTTANVFAVIEAGTGQTQISGYTVPAGYKCFIRDYSVAMSDKTGNQAEIAIWVRTFGGAERLVNHFSTATTYTPIYVPPGADPLPEKTDMMMRVEDVTSNGAHINFKGSMVCARDEDQ